MSNATNIRISRSKYIERDRGIAVLRLNMAQHLVGQPIMVRYYVDEEQTETDTLFAIGIKDGVGEDCYKVISLGGLNLVSDVVKELPDVSSLAHGELYLYQDENEVWYYVYEIDGDRQIEKITGGPYTFANIKDKYRWFFNDGILKREDDFYTKSQIDSQLKDLYDELFAKIQKIEQEQIVQNDWLLELDKVVFPMTMTLKNNTGTLFLTGTTQDIQFNIDVQRKGESVIDKCTFKLNNSEITLDASGNYTKTGVTSTTTFTFLAEHTTLTGVTASASNTVNFGYYFYYGVIPANGWTINETNVKALANRKLQIKTSTTFITNLSLQKIAFASPTVYGGIAHIYDSNGFDYIADYTRSNINIDGYDYYVYVKNSEVTVTNFRQQFTY